MKKSNQKQIETIEINERMTITCDECGQDRDIDTVNADGICEECRGLNDDEWDFEE